MTNHDTRTFAPLLVFVRDDESGWAHAAQQSRNPSKTPTFLGFLHTASDDELLAAMVGAGYERFARFSIDASTTTHWFAPVEPPPRPGETRLTSPPAATAA
jgi:hypothetical protein